jgi:hypothetical protein
MGDKVVVVRLLESSIVIEFKDALLLWLLLLLDMDRRNAGGGGGFGGVVSP